MHTLNPTRIGLLLRRLAVLRGAAHLRTLGIWLLVVAAVSFVPNVGGGDGSYFLNWCYALLLLVGAQVTLTALPETADADGRQSYLTLPASDTEKWFATWLYSGPLTVLAFSVLFALFVPLLNGLLGLWRAPLAPFTLLDRQVWEAVRDYLVFVHPLALLGVIAFNRSKTAMTIASAAVALAALALVAVLTVRIVFHDSFTGLFTPADDHELSLFSDDNVVGLSAWVAAGLLTASLLAASYFRFHEKEV